MISLYMIYLVQFRAFYRTYYKTTSHINYNFTIRQESSSQRRIRELSGKNVLIEVQINEEVYFYVQAEDEYPI